MVRVLRACMRVIVIVFMGLRRLVRLLLRRPVRPRVVSHISFAREHFRNWKLKIGCLGSLADLSGG